MIKLTEKSLFFMRVNPISYTSQKPFEPETASPCCQGQDPLGSKSSQRKASRHMQKQGKLILKAPKNHV